MLKTFLLSSSAMSASITRTCLELSFLNALSSILTSPLSTASSYRQAHYGRACRTYSVPLTNFYWSFVQLAVLPSSANSSEKVKHLLNNKKSGISFVRKADSSSLTGKAEIITDKDRLRRVWKDFLILCYPGGPCGENCCLIRFSTQKIKLWD